MKPLSLIILIILSIGCATAKKAPGNTSLLNGLWIPIRQELGGKELPAAAYQNQKLEINDSVYSFTAESVDKGVVRYGEGKMDIYGKEGVNSGKHFTAIYKLENGQLTVCYNLAGDNYPTAFETKSQPFLFLSIFKKEMAH